MLLAGACLAASACAPDPPAAVVGVVVDSCGPGQDTGSGALVGPGLVLTSAHVVAGAQDIRVVRDGSFTAAEIVGFDPDMDLAYLATDGLNGTPLPVSSDGVEAGDTGVAYVVRGGEVVAVPVVVRRSVTIRTEDVYVESETVRPGFELDAEIEPGDSGGAVVINGRVAGVVWARSKTSEGRAWVIDPDRAGGLIREQLRTDAIGDEIDLARCR